MHAGQAALLKGFTLAPMKGEFLDVVGPPLAKPSSRTQCRTNAD